MAAASSLTPRRDTFRRLKVAASRRSRRPAKLTPIRVGATKSGSMGRCVEFDGGQVFRCDSGLLAGLLWSRLRDGFL